MSLQTEPRNALFANYIRLSELIDNVGWDVAKNKYPDVRRTLQRLGTEAGREILGTNIWVETALKRASGDVVITDVRFPNEAQAIEEQDGILVRVLRPGVGPKNSHASENSLSSYLFKYTIHNTGTIEELHDSIVNLVENETGLLLV